MFSEANVLITGGTGSFGHAFVKRLLSDHEPKKVVIFSRDEMKQWKMSQLYEDDDRLRFFIGDVRDRNRVYRAFEGIDFVVHAAATKIVPIAEYNPFEAVKTNVHGAMNVIDAALDQGVRKVVALSTDKASSPINLYGATKLVSDKMFTAASSYAGSRRTNFSVVRYGNVMGSRGSVIPYFLGLKARGEPLRITDNNMTRFMISLEDGVSLVEKAFSAGFGGEIFVKKIPSMKIVDLAKAIAPESVLQEVGIRPGEKIHEQMIGEEDSPYTWEFEDHFRIFSGASSSEFDAKNNAGGKRVDPGFVYRSDTNLEWMTVDQLRNWLRLNQEKLLEI